MELSQGRVPGRGRRLPPYDPDNPGPHWAPATRKVGRWATAVVLAVCVAVVAYVAAQADDGPGPGGSVGQQVGERLRDGD